MTPNASGGFSAARVARPAVSCAAPYQFMADYSLNAVYVYSNKVLCVTLTSGIISPQFIDTDANGNLYVANFGGFNVLKFTPPYTGTPKVFADSNYYPVDVAACKGYIAIANESTSTGGNGSITIYRNGVMSIISDPNAVTEDRVTCDPSGNLYALGARQFGSAILDEFKGGKKPGIQLTAIENQTNCCAAMVWANGGLWIELAAPSITQWVPPFSSGGQTITFAGGVSPVGIKFSQSGKQILVSVPASDEGLFFNLSGHQTGTLTPGNTGGYPLGVSYGRNDPT